MRKKCIVSILTGVMLFSLVACGSKENTALDAPVSAAEVTQAADEGAQVELEEDGETDPTQTGQEPEGESTPTQTEKEPEEESTPAQTEKEPEGETIPAQTEKEPEEESAPAQTEKEPEGESAPAQTEKEPEGESTPAQTEKEPEEESTPAQTEKEPEEESAPAQTGQQPDKETQPTQAEADLTGEAGNNEQKTPTIQSVFAEYDMKVGTCLTTQMISKSYLADLIAVNFNSVTMENAMKPDYILDKAASVAAGDIVVRFNADMATMLDWARANNMAVRGHTIIWHSQTPEWIFHENFDTSAPFVTREVVLERMESYIKQVFGQLDDYGYTDLFYAYDVVNEAWMEDGKIREEMNYWYQIIGEDYLWYAFYYADQYAPDSIDLYYNDYNEQYKTDALLKFVNTLVDEKGNYLIDGIGLQAHLYTGDDLNNYLKTVERLGATGLKIELTELDVSLGTWLNTLAATDENLRMQGRYYYELIGGLFELVKEGKITTDALTFWGFADGLSWRKEASPLLYDTAYIPKYALYGVLQQKEKAGY